MMSTGKAKTCDIYLVLSIFSDRVCSMRQEVIVSLCQSTPGGVPKPGPAREGTQARSSRGVP